ncbi:GntR family transcriptional regulator [Lactovum odontotermitis]
MSKYIDIEEQIKKDILSGRYKSCLPTHEALAKAYKTSRVTISHVISILSSQGYVTTRRGQGTFINKGIFIQRQINEPFHLTTIFPGRASSEVISFEIRESDENERQKFDFKSAEPVYDIIRLRLLDNNPLQIEYTVMPVNLIPELDETVLHDSIYAYLVETLCLKLGKGNKIIRADRADFYDEKYLCVDKYTPILEVEQVGHLSSGKVFELSHTRVPYNKLELTMIQKLKS